MLVVDDEARSRDVWGLSLRKAGYDVITLRDAETALEAGTDRPDPWQARSHSW